MADPASRTITAEERKEAAAQVETLRGTVSKDIAFIIERTKNKNVVVSGPPPCEGCDSGPVGGRAKRWEKTAENSRQNRN